MIRCFRNLTCCLLKEEKKHEVHLQQDASLLNIGMNKMLVLENAGIKKQMQELLEKGNIISNTSSCGSSNVLDLKKDGAW